MEEREITSAKGDFVKISTPARSGSKKESALLKGAFRTIDQSFVLTKSQLEKPIGIDATHMYNGQPTQFTDIQSEEIKIDPSKTAMLKRSHFLPYDGVLYEINDAPIEQDAVWTFNGKTNLTHEEYLREVTRFEKLKLQYIVVKQNFSKTQDYSKSPYRPLTDFLPALVRKGPGRLKLLMPPTLILENTDRALFFTDAKTGYVRRVAGDYCDDAIIAKHLFPAERDAASMSMPAALIKRMSDGGNDCQLISAKTLTKILRDSVDGALLVQKYVKPRGPSAAMYRTTWRRSAAPSTVLVTGQKIRVADDSFSPSESESTTNILSFKGGGAIITSRTLAYLVNFLETGNNRCRFESFVADFIKDEHEQWYWVQAKSFSCTSVLST